MRVEADTRPLDCTLRPRILCVMRMPPDPDGHGGSQRAWHILQALQPYGDVHFVLLYRNVDADCVGAPLIQCEPLTASVTSICISDWNPAGVKKLGVFHPWLVDLIKFRSQVAPRFSRPILRQIAARLPLRDPDVIFACRLETAAIMQDLIDAELMHGAPRVVDFDDIISRFKVRQIASMGPQWGLQGPVLAKAEVQFIRRAEDRIAKYWNGLSVCTDEDVAALRARYPAQEVVKIVNIIARARLPERADDGQFRILFAGNLRFYANIDGLKKFVAEGWPDLVAAVPGAMLAIVGMNPLPEIVQMAKDNGFELYANVPDMRPFYENCDVVIAPILFGSGTRIKILEAMAYGRAIVSTSIGAEGLHVANHRDLLLADSMKDFAQCLVRLANDPGLRRALADNARALQLQYFGEGVLRRGLAALLMPALARTST